MLDFDSLKKTYGNFSKPVSVIKVDGKDISKDKLGLAISDIQVELTSGFEASVASFSLYNTFDRDLTGFITEDVQKYITLGSAVQIFMGYGTSAREVFYGIITRVNFNYHQMDVPCITVTAMDVKGAMMANCSFKQFTGDMKYSLAVKKILEQPFYESYLNGGLKITETPENTDENPSAYTVEMNCESDYEFVVKAAKKFNYEFYTIGGTVYFRKAKENKNTLITITPETLLQSFDVTYDISGLVGSGEVRNENPGEAKQFASTSKMNNKISQKSKAKKIVNGQKKVYIDPTADDKTIAQYRSEYLAERMAYRFGSLKAEMVGLPEIIPGCFIELGSLGTTVSNQFYLTRVRHTQMGDTGKFRTVLEGRSATIK